MQELRFALRQLRRAPGFAAAAVLTLALGIGANTGIYSVLNGALRPLPVPDADRLVVVAARLPLDDTGFRFQHSYPAVRDYQASTRAVFSDVFAYDNRMSGLTARGTTTQFVYQAVTGNAFTALRLEPAAGRFFVPGEGEATGTERLLVLGYQQWQRRFDGDPAVVGTVVRLDGDPARIIGVAPRGFHGLVQHAEIDGYVTLGMLRTDSVQRGTFFSDRRRRTLTMLARLQPGVSVGEAQTAVDLVARRLQLQFPSEEKDVTARVIPETSARPVPAGFLSDLMPVIYGSVLGVAGLVLLIACMNVANLLLVRATARQREMAVRASLGASRAGLVRLMLAESLLLSVAGLALGLAFARLATWLFIRAINPSFDIGLNLQFDFDWPVFAYAAAVALVSGTLMGLMPALRASRVRISGMLHDGGHGSAGPAKQRLRTGLVIAQVAGSLILLILAGLCVRNLQRAQWMDLGFVSEGIVTVRLDPRQIGYSEQQADLFYEELERRLRAQPGVEHVASTVSVPMGYIFFGCLASPEGAESTPVDGPGTAYLCNPVGTDYFEVMKLPILEGRAFTEHDGEETTPAVIVNETLAKRLWPNGGAVGKRIVMPSERISLRTVVGVARDSKYLAPFEHPLPYLYVSMKQNASSLRVVHVRVSGRAEAFAPVLEREIRALAPDVPLADLKTMRQLVEGGMSLLFFRLAALQVGALGVLGLLLAVVGVYGVVSYTAGQRTREMGIRLALGAEPRAIERLVLGHGARMVIAGIAAGLAAAIVATRALSRLFVIVGSNDTVTFAGVTVLLGAIALMACYLPARRAMRVNPIVALRHE